MPYTSLTSAIRDKLVNTTAITDICSTRIYPSYLPQNPTLPAIVFKLIDDKVPSDTLEGTGSLFRAVMEFNVFASTYSAAKNLSEEIRLAIQGYSGTNLSVNIKGVHFENEFDDFEEEIANHVIVLRFAIWHKETNV